ncbi:Calcineurin subunit B [Nosema granulosis]|uniref:Calcineurin subunit B n=1 Tax=Nosema granulosis TaxID=83296 RepID=A0A9P6GXP6_9MICR|nr:Calcineurin subunit B [Nosema granulosis]
MDFKDRIKVALRNRGELRDKDLLNIKAIKQNPIAERLIESYTKEGKIDFDVLYSDLHSFVNKKDLDLKLKFIFKVYDSDNDGFITKVDLFNVLKSYSDCKSEKILTDIISFTFGEAGLYSETIDYPKFKEIIMSKSRNMNKLLRY